MKFATFICPLRKRTAFADSSRFTKKVNEFLNECEADGLVAGIQTEILDNVIVVIIWADKLPGIRFEDTWTKEERDSWNL